ncbi:hypothetical protein [Anaerococcus sp.]|uniref:hypothetical protein n=1 Tax=Anaerococcus sp. TaxID=1872515 RepID=UPI00280A5B1C|nr:hypothetical protein [Anaerococcus sp.]MDU3176663.1 hypothetical protein [Anaerococcus sp.]
MIYEIEDLDLMYDIKFRRGVFRFFKNYESCHGISKCMARGLGDNCKGKIIKAHSISKENGLDKIATVDKGGGKCVGKFIKGNETTINPFNQEYKAIYVPTKIASTFTGMCSKHDNDLFKTIDECRELVIDDQTVFEYTLRNAIYNSFDRMSNSECMLLRIQKYLQLFPDTDCPYIKIYNHIHHDEQILDKEVKKLYRLRDDTLNKLYYKSYKIEGNINIAGNFYTEENSIVYFITIIPGLNESNIIVSCVRDNNFIEMNEFFNFLNSLTLEYLQIFITYRLLSSTGIRHYYFNYDKWNSLDEDFKNECFDWIYFEDIHRTFDFNTSLLEANIPNFIAQMTDKPISKS